MTDAGDWNSQVVAEFRANDGKVGGPFAGAPVAILHHRGRKTGRELVAPVMYLADDNDAATIYVFASKAGAPTNPDWYYNLIAAGTSEVEVGSETYRVKVEELAGADRARVFAEQAQRYSGFADYAEKTKGVRTIPVLALRRT